MAGGLDIGNFVFRYGADGLSQGQVADHYAAIDADLLVMESCWWFNDFGADIKYTAEEIAEIKAGAGGKLVMAYTSIGSIERLRDEYSGMQAHAARDADGDVIQRPTGGMGSEVFLRVWDEAGAAPCNLALLDEFRAWIGELHDLGYDGAFLDVPDSYRFDTPDLPIRDDVPGATLKEDQFIGARAVMTMVVELAAYADDLPGGFKLVLGNNPQIIRDYLKGVDPDGAPKDAALVEAFRAAVDGLLVETTIDFTGPDKAGRQLLAMLDPAGPYGFGDASLLAMHYELSTPQMLRFEINAALQGWLGYAPHDFFATYPVFNLADAGPNALLADAAGGDLAGLAGADLLAGRGGVDTLSGGLGSDTVEGGGGADRLAGGKGRDVLRGDAGRDHLSGGLGADAFDFSVLERVSDTIADLEAGDRIRLSDIDADVTTPGDQAFHLAAGFSGVAGEAVLSYQAARNRTLLQLDVDGDGAADMIAYLVGDHSGFTNFAL